MKRYRSRRGERGLIASRFLFFPGGQRGESLACLWHETGLMAPFFFVIFPVKGRKGVLENKDRRVFFLLLKERVRKCTRRACGYRKGEREKTRFPPCRQALLKLLSML